MSSTPQTRGFDVGVVPGYQLANPSYFNPYANLQQGLQSGVNMGAQIQDILLKNKQEQDNAEIQPLRVKLMQAELAHAHQQQHLADIQLPGQEIKAKEPIRIKQSEFLDLDEGGNLAKFGSFKVIDPVTGEVGHQPRAYLGTVKTKDQLEQDKLNAAALRDYRTGLGTAAQTKAVTAQQLLQWKQQNPTVKTKTFYDKDLNVFEQAINPDGSLGASVQIILPDGSPAKRPASQMDGLAAALGALAGPQNQPAPAQPHVMNPVAPAPTQLPPSPQTNPPVSASMPAGAPSANLDALGNLANQFAAAPVTIQTKAQYDALPVGASYIDALTGTRHVKGR